MTTAITILLLTSATTGIVLGTGRSTPLPASLLMVAFLSVIWLAKMLLNNHPDLPFRRIYLKPSPLNLPVLGFLVVAVVAWIIGYAIWDWRVPQPEDKFLVQAGQYAIYAFSFVVMFLTAHQSIHENHLKLWTLILICIGFGEIFLEFFLKQPFGSTLGITGVLLVIPIILAAAQLLFNPDLKNFQRIIIFILLFVWLAWAYQTRVFKGGWMPAMFGLVILAFFRSWKLFIVGVIIAGIIILLNWGTLIDIFYRPEVESTSTLRPLVWWDVIRMTLPRSPVLGLGLVNYMDYWSDPTFIPLSRIAAGWEAWNAWGYAIPSHNMFVDIFAQTGFVGFFFFLWAMAAALWVVHRVLRTLQPGFLKGYVVGVFASFAAMLIGSFLFADWLLPFVYNITITGFRQSVYAWILLGSVLGMYYQIQEKAPNKEEI